MPLSFPNTPSVNDVYAYGDNSWTWTGTSWVAIGQPLTGPQGATGAGFQGVQGAAGPQGAQGAQGFQGADNVSQIYGKQTIFVPGYGINPSLTNGANFGSIETANGILLRTLDFDPTTQQFGQFAIQMPKSWNEGNIIAQFVWSHPVTSTNFGVVWALQCVAFTDASNVDKVNWGTETTVTDTGGIANTTYITSNTGNIAFTGTVSPESWVAYRVKRNPADAADTMAVNARLHGVKILYTIDAARDD